MVADTVDLDEAAGGERIEGMYFGALTFTYKFSQAAALVLIGLALDLAGFDSSLPAQRGGTALALGLLLGLGASASFGMASLALKRYGLDEAAVAANRARIAALRGEGA
jgi:Na+/melibiose symporter-like transporter